MTGHGTPAVLVTGAAGFIGFHLTRRLLSQGRTVVGLDSLSPYYDVALKRDRLAVLGAAAGFRFVNADVADADALRAAFAEVGPIRVVHLAAQAGVRYSIDHPEAYGAANLTGFLNILEACRRHAVGHLVYASSSSVYGGNARLPFSTLDPVDHPVSLYAATKKANELMAHSYAHLYGLPATGLRFFTVYGPWGRPDMAYWKFTEAIAEGRPIDVYNEGRMGRDFTYVDDVIDVVCALIDRPAAPDPAFDRLAPQADRSWAPHRVHNIGATHPQPLMTLIETIEQALGRKAALRMMPMQPGDVTETAADMAELQSVLGFAPKVGLTEGVGRFVDWWRDWRARR
jgi:UDP-glucuronate 4-epimerase